MADAAQYAIEIAARIDGANTTSAQIDELAAKLSGTGVKSAAFDDAMLRVSHSLGQAADASRTASAALADGRAEFSQLEQALVRAQKASERASLKGTVPLDTVARVAAAQAAVTAYAGKLSRLESEAEQAAAAQKHLGAQMGNLRALSGRVNDRLGDAATKLSTFRGALGDVGGPLGQLGERLLSPVQALVDLREFFGLATAAGVVAVVGFAAVAAAVAALSVAMLAGVGAAAAYGVQLADTARSASLTREAFNTLRPELAGLDWGGLTNATGQAEDALRGSAIALLDAKVAAADLPAALRAVATADAALGAGKGLELFTKSVKEGKRSVNDFATATQRAYGDIAARQMLGLEAQGARLQRNVAGIFDGLNIDAVLAGMTTLVGVLDENSVMGRALKAVFEGVLQPLIDQAQLAAWVVEAFVLGVVIGFTKLYLASKPAIDAVAELLGFDTSGWDLEATLAGVTKAGEWLAPILLGLAAGLALIGVVVLAAVAGVGVLVAAAFGLGAAVGYAIGVVLQAAAALGGAFGSALRTAVDAVKSFGGRMLTAGIDLMRGLAAGITAGAGAVVAAITGAVGGAIAAAKRQLGIASPSKVFATIGGQTAEGFAGGVDDGAGAAQGALEDLVSPTPALLRAGGEAPAARGGGRSSTTVNVTINGVAGAVEAAERIREVITATLRGDALAIAGAS